MRNIELKCRCPDLEAARERALRLGATEAGELLQTDVFFPAPVGRLKLRLFADGAGELIAYSRPDHPGARGSDYLIYPTGNPSALREALEASLGVLGLVRKRRYLLLYRNTRIHLDEVAELGTFVELETVLREQAEQDAHDELASVAAALQLDPADAIPGAYLDLLPSPRD